MISRNDLQQLVHREPNGRPVLSVFLDTSVNSDQKRTHDLFLKEQRARLAELADRRRAGQVRELEDALGRVDVWLASEFIEASRGVALYTELGGDWFQAFQFPVRLDNRLEIADAAVVGPLAAVLENAARYTVALVDREHLRLLDVVLGRLLDERELRPDPYPARHAVKAGGYSAKDHQKRKAEEVRHYFKDFAQELDRFERGHHAEHLIVLGTDENASHFLEFLPEPTAARVVHTAHAPVDESVAAVLARLAPFFEQHASERRVRTVDLLLDRVRHSHFAVGGYHTTLEQLQEGKVGTLVIARGAQREGARCTRCGFVLARQDSLCPYCGGETQNGVDVVEAMIRMAAAQDADVEFTDPRDLTEVKGVGALLRF